MDSLRHPDQWERAFERRSVGRIRTAIGALLFFSAQSGAHSCTIRDFTNVGAGIRVQDLPILPLKAAAEALLLVVDLGGPTMFARIGVMRALNRGHVRAFNPTRKDPHWGRRKLARDR